MNSIGKVLDAGLGFLILLNVVAVILGSVGRIEEKAGVFLAVFEYVSIAIFSIEFGVRLGVAIKTGKKYLRSPLGIIDLLSILPFYIPGVFVDLRILRILRVLRLLRVLKLFRYGNSGETIVQVLKNSKHRLYRTFFFMTIMIVLSAAFMFTAENAAQPDQFPNIPSALWWAVGAITTVGYGDVYPVTNMGRLLGGIIAILGIGLIAMPTGIISAEMVKATVLKNRNSINLSNIGSLKKFHNMLEQVRKDLSEFELEFYESATSKRDINADYYGRRLFYETERGAFHFWIGALFEDEAIYFSVWYKGQGECPAREADILKGLEGLEPGKYFDNDKIKLSDWVEIRLRDEYYEKFRENTDIREQRDIIKNFIKEILDKLK
ncbi:MAG: ion transporter [Treponema sp.]|nr:ion transporter [Treponema sp.]